jgi:hypothetical protein
MIITLPSRMTPEPCYTRRLRSIRADSLDRRKQFIRKIQDWGLYKNVKEKEKRRIDHMERKRKEVDDKKTITKLRGREVTAAKLERWRKTQAAATMDGASEGVQQRVPESPELDAGNSPYSFEDVIC